MENEHVWTAIISAVVSLLIGGPAGAGIVWQIMKARQQQRKDDQTWVSDVLRSTVDRQDKKIDALQAALDAAKEERMKMLAENIDLKAELNRWKALHQDKQEPPPAASQTSTSC